MIYVKVTSFDTPVLPGGLVRGDVSKFVPLLCASIYSSKTSYMLFSSWMISTALPQLEGEVDTQSTMISGDHTVEVPAWYDDKWGYSRRVADLMKQVFR